MAVALATLAIGGCSHGTVSELPTAPTAPTPILRVLTITPVGGGTMLVGGSAPITTEGPLSPSALGAFAQYSDGSSNYVKATWTTSDPNIVDVDGTQIVAKGRGTATLTATVGDMKDTEDFVVEPGIEGSWAGTYVIEKCDAGTSTIYEAICAAPSGGRPGGVLPVGTAAPIALQITRGSGSDLVATAALGEIRGTLTGTDRGQNYLTFKGDLLSPGGNRVSFVYWDARVKTDLMEGFIAFEVYLNGLPSWAQVTAHFDNLTRR